VKTPLDITTLLTPLLPEKSRDPPPYPIIA
jgi:hypothetical protein